jgi:glutamate--cysteine ligase catalytic subunit
VQDNTAGRWVPEFTKFQLESTPYSPYTIDQLATVEQNMKNRRLFAQQKMHDDESIVTITSFPLLGVGRPYYPPIENMSFTESRFVPDNVMGTHPRNALMSCHIRERRGSNICIEAPLFVDVNTNLSVGITCPVAKKIINYKELKQYVNCFWINCGSKVTCESNNELVVLGSRSRSTSNERPQIYMDGETFDSGCCCLQITQQCTNMKEARYLYDQLAILSPIMLALTAATPIFKGLLTDYDVRWPILRDCVDDRQPHENISKTRYDTISTFISERTEEYCDIQIEINKRVKQILVQEKVDEMLSRHISHLFIRDPLVIYLDFSHVDDTAEMDHFKNIQSTNWNNVRFKPPSVDGSLGWRVEFHVMEVSMSDFKNAAFVIFVVLLSRAILFFDLNFYMPLSMVDRNFELAYKRDAVLKEEFSFRKDLRNGTSELINTSVDELINGKEGKIEGLLPIIYLYLDAVEIHDKEKLRTYLTLVSNRASGKVQTTAAFLRSIVTNHADYRQDSVVSEQIAFDLIHVTDCIGKGEVQPAQLFNQNSGSV